MRKAFEYCKPVLAKAVPTGPDWIHEVKYDGYRGRVVKDGPDVKLLSKSGLDWAWRFPWIVETALKMKQQHFIIDGEICVLDVQGISDFNALHSNRHNDEAQLYAFDLVALTSCSIDGRKGSSRRPRKPVRSGPGCMRPPAGWGWKDWSQSIGSGATGQEPVSG